MESGQESSADWLFLEEFRPWASKIAISSASVLQWILSGISLVFCILVLLLAHWARTDLLVLKITATFFPPVEGTNTPVLSASAEHVYGYLGELNHGLFYLFIAPVFIWVTFQFCRHIGISTHEMIRTGMIEEGLAGSVQRFIQKLNRCSLPILALLMLVTLGLNFHKEYGSMDKLESGDLSKHPWSYIGYVQTPCLYQWVQDYNQNPDGETGRARLIEDKFYTPRLSAALASQVAFEAKYGSLDTKPLVASHLLTRGPGLDPLVVGVDIPQSAGEKRLLLKASANGGREKFDRCDFLFYRAFLISALVMEGLFHGFCGWAAIKIIFYVLLMFNLLPHRGTSAFALNPWLRDTEKRFGMDPVFRVYNLIALAISIGASFLFLQGYNTLDARTESQVFHLMPILQILGLAAVGLALLFLLAGPALVFRRQLVSLQTEEVKSLEGNLRKLKDEQHQERKDLMETIRLIRAQTTWPRTDASFLSTIGFSFACLLFPFPALFGLAPSNAQEWGTLAGRITELIHAILKSMYHF
ncbi:MAG: hypothetical protein PHD76_05075 [Methylacidiphilales bacterium]|nr:hypothetical protein [Candidatus Methylacidiphilales bacterium]